MHIYGMPRTADLETVRRILESDRTWAVYALSDLAPDLRAYTEWHVAAGGRLAVLLIYRAFRPPVLFTFGDAADLAPLVAEVASEPEFYLSVKAEVINLLTSSGYQIRHEKRMQRMLADPSASLPEHRAERLGPADYEDLVQLYADGAATGETPPFFAPGMLPDGVYYGIRENGALIAAAGTHVLAAGLSLAAIGNVYTRRDRRGQGHGLQVTAAVTGELIRRGLRTIALNVEQSNAAAIRIYERLGFRPYCEYREGIAMRSSL